MNILETILKWLIPFLCGNVVSVAVDRTGEQEMSIYNVQCPVFAEAGGICVTLSQKKLLKR